MQDRLRDAEVFVALLLLNHLISLSKNCFSFLELVSPDIVQSSCEDHMATAVLRLHNLLNHSCDPNIYAFICNRQHVLFATRQIKAGKQVSKSH